MFFKESDDQRIERFISKTDASIKENSIQQEALDKEVQELLKELKVTPQQIAAFISAKENFTMENWEELQEQRKILDEKLSRSLNHIPDPLKTRKTQAERNVGRHWLFVK